MDARQVARALKTPVTLLILVAVVYLAARWGWDEARKPIPPRPMAPCVVKQVGPTLLPEHVYVNVYNGSKTNGLARRLAQILSADGFKVYKRVNADNPDHAISEVVGRAEDAPEVQVVRQAFQDIAFRADGRNDGFVDVIIGEAQPVLLENPQFGVALPEGTACLADPPVSAPTE